jgi:hypothetical protein
MRLLNRFLILLFPILFSFSLLAQSNGDCNRLSSLEVKVKIEDSGRSVNTVKLEFDEKAIMSDYAIMISARDREKTSVYKNGEKEFDLKPGNYDIYIIDKNGCSKQLNLKVN